MATTAELKTQIDAWVATFIHQVIDFKAPLAPTAERLNELFNLLITQGDDTSSIVKTIRDYLDAYTADLDATIATDVQTKFDELAAPLTSSVQAATKSAQDAAAAAQAAKESASLSTAAANLATSVANNAATTANNAATTANNAATTANQAAVTANQAATDASNAAATFAIAETAGGTANAITLQNILLTDGYIKSFVASANNNGTATTINTLPVFIDGTSNPPTFETAKMYTIRYRNANGGSFFVKASAIGTAVAPDVLAGKTFSNSDGINITGTLVDKSGVTTTAPTATATGASTGYIDVTVPVTAKYSVGSNLRIYDADFVAANFLATKNIFGAQGAIPSKAAQTYNPSNAAQTIASGQYLSGVQTIAAITGTAVPADVASGKTFWSAGANAVQTGTAVAGKKYASGTTTVAAGTKTFYSNGFSSSKNYVQVAGLPFLPSVIVLSMNGNINTTYRKNNIVPGQYTIACGVNTYDDASYDTNSSAYINSTSFLLPTNGISSGTITWEIYE